MCNIVDRAKELKRLRTSFCRTGHTMPRILFDSLRANRVILEIRYPKGYLYWDVCGRCIREINTKSKQRIDFVELRGDECILKFVETPEAQATFGLKHMILSANKVKNMNLFRENGPLIFDSVKTYLEIDEISRVGFRSFYVLEKPSYQEAEEFVNSLQLCSATVERFKGFGNELSIAQPIVLVTNEAPNARICISPAKRTDADEPGAKFDEFAPRYAVLVDIDFYLENVKPPEFDLDHFIYECHKKIKDHVAELLNK